MTRPTTPPHRPRGFTLVELLVVMVILGTLIALLLPAIMQAVSSARNASVTAEINAMGQALAQFKGQYGDYPPSRIFLSESGNYSAAAFTTGNVSTALGNRSIAYLRKFWPRLQISTSGAVPNAFYNFRGLPTTPSSLTSYVITGDECLVLFLGGIPQAASSGNGFSVAGFSKSPINPFIGFAATSNRTTPLFDFKSERLVDQDSNGMPEYQDALGGAAPAGIYAYFSSYSGLGYDPDDVNYAQGYKKDAESTTLFATNAVLVEGDPAGTVTSMFGGFMAPNDATPSGPLTIAPTSRPDLVSSPLPNPYTTDSPLPVTAGAGTVDTWLIDTTSAKTSTPAPYQNPQSFQIVSSGRDRLYGMGGQYSPNSAASTLPFYQTANSSATGQSLGNDARSAEQDNLTNFATGRLQ